MIIVTFNFRYIGYIYYDCKRVYTVQLRRLQHVIRDLKIRRINIKATSDQTKMLTKRTKSSEKLETTGKVRPKKNYKWTLWNLILSLLFWLILYTLETNEMATTR